jgi:hypothetical protein
MWTAIECAGHPRDMGLAQGGALATEIRAACATAGLDVRRSRLPSLRGLNVGPCRGSGAGREFFRHFPHQAERLEGLARSAKVSVEAVLELHLRVREGGAAGGLLSRRSALRAHSLDEGEAAKRTLLERSLPVAGAGEARWMLRESRPAVGFRSLEIGLPWLVPGVAGVNEGGLAIMAGPILWGEPGRSGWPFSALLVQECLQRFDELAGALDWCHKRPVEGEQSFVLADASGSVATVISSGRERRVQEGEGELYLEGGELPASSAQDDTQDNTQGNTQDDTQDRTDASRDASPDRVVLDPRGRSLRLEAQGTSIAIDLH